MSTQFADAGLSQQHKLAAVQAMLDAGSDLKTALFRLKLAPSTYHKWIQKAKRPELAARPGRPAHFAPDEHDMKVLHWFAAHTESATRALEEFMLFAEPRASVPHAPGSGAARMAIRIHQEKARRKGRPWEPTGTMKRAVAITKAERNFIRGGRAKLSTDLIRPRSQMMTILNKDGDPVEVPMWPGCGYVSDDMSINTPFSYIGPDGKPTLGRQSLMTRDINSLQWLGADLIGRPRQSYQVEDIADHFLFIVDCFGLPFFWRIERGPWDNDFFNGIKLPPEYGRPEKERWGGLNQLINIKPKFLPRGKGEVEGGFRRIQDFMHHLSTDVGRTRGEYQTASRLYAKALRGCLKSQAYFWEIEAAMMGLKQVMERDNGKAKYRASLGGKLYVPDEMWAERRTTPLATEDRWRFLPVKRALTLQRHCVVASSKHWPMGFQFEVNAMEGVRRIMENGYRLLVAFHPGRPEEGAAIFNGEIGGSPRNLEGRPFGSFIGTAPWVPAVPNEDFTGTGDYGAQRRANAAVRKVFRNAVPNGTGPGTLKSTARDGLGRALHSTKSLTDLDPAPAPDAKRPRRMSGTELAALYSSAG